jgi:hypothetical protein
VLEDGAIQSADDVDELLLLLLLPNKAEARDEIDETDMSGLNDPDAAPGDES